MSKMIPSKPPRRPFRPAYAVTTTARVPGGRVDEAVRDVVEPPSGPAPEATGLA